MTGAQKPSATAVLRVTLVKKHLQQKGCKNNGEKRRKNAVGWLHR
ncbi:MAG: hypothetical protein ACPHO0_02820 [Luminiphilus sp.]